MNKHIQEHILKTAAREFADYGYRETTIRTICQKAGVNIASVNYYFRTKNSLYKKVVKYLFERIEKSPLELCVYSDEKEWEKDISDFISEIYDNVNNDSFVYRSFNRIMFWEMLSPSEVFPDIYRKYIQPFINKAEHMICAGIPDKTSKEHIRIIVFSLISQCLFYSQNRVIAKKTFGKKFYPMNPKFCAKALSEVKRLIFTRLGFQKKKNNKRNHTNERL